MIDCDTIYLFSGFYCLVNIVQFYQLSASFGRLCVEAQRESWYQKSFQFLSNGSKSCHSLDFSWRICVWTFGGASVFLPPDSLVDDFLLVLLLYLGHQCHTYFLLGIFLPLHHFNLSLIIYLGHHSIHTPFRQHIKQLPPADDLI